MKGRGFTRLHWSGRPLLDQPEMALCSSLSGVVTASLLMPGDEGGEVVMQVRQSALSRRLDAACTTMPASALRPPYQNNSLSIQ